MMEPLMIKKKILATAKKDVAKHEDEHPERTTVWYANEYLRTNVYYHVLMAEILEQRHILNKIHFVYPSLE